MQSVKEFKRGEVLFKEGEPADKLYVIQSGRVLLYLERQGKKVEIEELKTSQVVGEMAAIGGSKHPFSAECQSPTKVLELPAKVIQTQNESSPAGIKIILKSVLEALKQARNKIKSYKFEQDNSPLPQMLIPKVFSLFVLLGHHIGRKNEEGQIVLSWQALKLYSTRVFAESGNRLLGAIDLLKKLGYIEVTTRVNEEEEEELNDIIFLDLQTIEDFMEFYQFHLFKPGRSEAIYVDSTAFKIVKALVQLAYDKEVNHRGAVELKYEDVLQHVKAQTKLDLKNTHFDLLEKKGLLVQRKSTDNGLLLLLDKEEFIKTAVFWAFIFEIDQWNEKGFVDFKAVAEETSSSLEKCADCGSEIQQEQKFCSNCGAKLAA